MMCENNNFIEYKELINSEFDIFRKSDEYFPIYLIAKEGGDAYEINVNYPQNSLNLKDIDVVIEKNASLKKVCPKSLYVEVQSKIVKLIKDRHQEK